MRGPPLRLRSTTLKRLSTRLHELRRSGSDQKKDLLGRTAVRKADKANPEYVARMARRAAVLVPLCVMGGELGVLFTKRSATRVGSHKGHVSFPGGHIEVGETARDAALREYDEEVGAGLSAVVWRGATVALGELAPVRAVTGTMVYPVVGILGQTGGAAHSAKGVADMAVVLTTEGALAPPCPEVDLVFGVTLRDLRDPIHRTEDDLGYRGSTVPRFQIPGLPPIWGLTGFILNDLLDAFDTLDVDIDTHIRIN